MREPSPATPRRGTKPFHSTIGNQQSTINDVAELVDYSEVFETLTAAGLQCLYHNSGAFGFRDETATQSVGWILREDSTIKPAARALATVIEGNEAMLAERAVQVWKKIAPQSPAWVLPKSHWAYELTFGSYAWLPAALAAVGLDANELSARNDGSAIEFASADSDACRAFVETLLRNLAGSDFMLVLGGGKLLCTIHHHKQLWWTASDIVMLPEKD